MKTSASFFDSFRSQLQAERQLRETQAEAFSSQLACLEQELASRRRGSTAPASVHVPAGEYVPEFPDQQEVPEPERLEAAAPLRPSEVVQERALEPERLQAAAPPPPPSPPEPMQEEAQEPEHLQAVAPPPPEPLQEEAHEREHLQAAAPPSPEPIQKEAPEPEGLKAAAPPPPEPMQKEALEPKLLEPVAPPMPREVQDESAKMGQEDLEDELPPLEDLPASEPSKAAPPPQEQGSRSSSKEVPRALPSPQAKALAAPAPAAASPAMEASPPKVSKSPERVRDRRLAAEVLKDAGVALEPEAMFRALLSPSSMNVTKKQVYPVVSVPEEPEDLATVQEERQQAMSKLLTNRLKLNQPGNDEEPTEEETMSPEEMSRYEEELHVQQEGAMKNALQTIFKALS